MQALAIFLVGGCWLSNASSISAKAPVLYKTFYVTTKRWRGRENGGRGGGLHGAHQQHEEALLDRVFLGLGMAT